MGVLKNAKHERFARGLAEGKSADGAYAEAGFKPNRGNATTLKHKQSIQQRVAELLAQEREIEQRALNKAVEATGITKERVLSELGKIGFSDIRKAFTESGGLKRPEEWDDEFAGSVASVKVVTRQSGERDENDRPILEHVHEFKAWDKRAALVDLGKHLGMFKDDGEKAGDIHIHFDAELKGVL